MRRLLLPATLVFAIILFFGWVNQRPPVPEFTPLANPVKLDFEVDGVEGNALELGLVRGARGHLFMKFDVRMEGSRPIVTLNGAGGRSTIKGVERGQKLPDWPFLQGRDGRPVLNFAFQNQLVELPNGKTAVRMTYAGPNVPLLHALRVGRPTTLPPFIGKALGHDGPVQLQPGTYRVDRNAGVTIDAKLLGG